MSDQVIRDTATGKISLINCFTAFNSAAFPFQAPPFFITALVFGVAGKGKPIHFKVSIKKRDSENYILDISGEATPQGTADPDEIAEMVWAIPSLIFPEVGVYDIVITINREEFRSRSLIVKAITGAPVQIK